MSNTTAYAYYRLYVTAVGVGYNTCIIVEMELFDVVFIEGFGYSTPADAGGHGVDVSECRIKIASDHSGAISPLSAVRR